MEKNPTSTREREADGEADRQQLGDFRELRQENAPNTLVARMREFATTISIATNE